MDFKTLHELNYHLATAIEPYKPIAATTLRTCDHTRRYPHHCNSPYCILCRQWGAYQQGLLLTNHMIVAGGLKQYFTTFTAPSVEPSQIKHTVQALGKGYRKLIAAERPVMAGNYRWLEITADDISPELENVHLHGVFAMSPQFSGKKYLSRAAWGDLWRKCVGSRYFRNSHIESAKDPERIGGYISAIDKFIADAELGIQDPMRYITRAEQTHRLRRYVGDGVLAQQPNELSVFFGGEHWKRHDCQLTRRVHSSHYKPSIAIEIEGPPTRVVQGVHTGKTDFAFHA